MKYAAVLFDMNGVIVDDEPLHLAAFQAVMRARGQTLTDEQYRRYFAGRTDKDGFVDYLSETHQAFDLDVLLREKGQAYLAMAQRTLKPYEGVVDFIQSLKAAGVPLALVTSSLRAEAQAVLEAFGLTDCFSAVITADDIQKGKPDPEGYLKGARAFGVESAACVVIEDAPSGIKAAKAAGMSCVAVLNTHAREELSGADILVSQLDAQSLDLFV